MEENIIKDSVVIYRSWFECLRAFGPKTFYPAFDALFSYAFYGKEISQNEIPEVVVKVLDTFVPLIDKNRKNCENGKKGAIYGVLGGRPAKKTPEGLPANIPDGVSSPNPTVTVNDTETVNEKGTVSVTAGDGAPHTDFDFYFPVFFFRNLIDPKGECNRFLDYYVSSDWTLQGGMRLDTDEKRLAKARGWNPKVPDKRFGERFLATWKELYEMAPGPIRKSMLNDRTEGKLNGSTYEIRCEQIFYDWLHSIDFPEKKKEILDKWTGGAPIKYYKTR